jgi:hypothetical protein
MTSPGRLAKYMQFFVYYSQQRKSKLNPTRLTDWSQNQIGEIQKFGHNVYLNSASTTLTTCDVWQCIW